MTICYKNKLYLPCLRIIYSQNTGIRVSRLISQEDGRFFFTLFIGSSNINQVLYTAVLPGTTEEPAVFRMV